MSSNTIARGRQQMLDRNVSPGRTRRSGAADASLTKKNRHIVTLIEFLLDYDTAGDPITGLKLSPSNDGRITLAARRFRRHSELQQPSPAYSIRKCSSTWAAFRVGRKPLRIGRAGPWANTPRRPPGNPIFRLDSASHTGYHLTVT